MTFVRSILCIQPTVSIVNLRERATNLCLSLQTRQAEKLSYPAPKARKNAKNGEGQPLTKNSSKRVWYCSEALPAKTTTIRVLVSRNGLSLITTLKYKPIKSDNNILKFKLSGSLEKKPRRWRRDTRWTTQITENTTLTMNTMWRASTTPASTTDTHSMRSGLSKGPEKTFRRNNKKMMMKKKPHFIERYEIN